MVLLKCLAAFAALSSLTQAAPAPQKRALSFDYGNQKVRGVNLGGWLVLEPWITPSIFQAAPAGVVDEYTFTQALGKTEAQKRLNSHWSSWVTLADFQEIASDGLNHVRIPVGYWALNPLDGDPYVQGQLPYLDQAIVWARQTGIKVLLDLHGAPGSQNGFDNSGRYGAINWLQGSTTSQTIQAVRNLAFRYKNDLDVVTAIEVLNEPLGPAGLNMDAVKQFYLDSYGNVRDSSPDTAVVFHDAFMDINNYWSGWGSNLNHAILDTHIYQVFSNGENSRTPAQHIANACTNGPRLKATTLWSIVGEWTGAQTDCALYLNGMNKGARYDGTFVGSEPQIRYGDCAGKRTGSVANMSQADKTHLRMYVEAQLDAYEQHSGWIFWAWKTESAPEWHFRDLVRNGLIPKPLTSRQYPRQCGY